MSLPNLADQIKQTLSRRPLDRGWARRDIIKLTAASAATVGVGFLGYGAIVRDHVEVSKVDVKINNLPPEFDGLTMAQMSDIHHGPYTGLDYIDRCVQIVNDLKPDLIALTGDFTFSGRRHIEPCAEVLKNLKARIGVYVALGNHDYYVGASYVTRAMSKAGFIVLVDEHDQLEHRGEKISLIGVDDFLYGNTNLNQIMRRVPQNRPKIVLSHNPDFIEEFAIKNKHIDLMVAGHTHGGQIRFPLLGAPQIASDYGQKYAIGLNRRGAMQVYTTRGIGTIILPTRFDCPPEIVLYTLRTA